MYFTVLFDIYYYWTGRSCGHNHTIVLYEPTRGTRQEIIKPLSEAA